jgi:hypothetical protein
MAPHMAQIEQCQTPKCTLLAMSETELLAWLTHIEQPPFIASNISEKTGNLQSRYLRNGVVVAQ